MKTVEKPRATTKRKETLRFLGRTGDEDTLSWLDEPTATELAWLELLRRRRSRPDRYPDRPTEVRMLFDESPKRP